MTKGELATVIERSLVMHAPRGRSFAVTSLQCMECAGAVLAALSPSPPLATWRPPPDIGGRGEPPIEQHLRSIAHSLREILQVYVARRP